MTALRSRLETLAKALRQLHSALLDQMKGEYEFMHGKVSSPFTLYNLVTSAPEFQWLRPLSGLMSTLDEVIDQKGAPHTERHFADVRQAYGLLMSGTDTRFSAYKAGVDKFKHDPHVRQALEQVREILESHPA